MGIVWVYSRCYNSSTVTIIAVIPTVIVCGRFWDGLGVVWEWLGMVWEWFEDGLGIVWG